MTWATTHFCCCCLVGNAKENKLKKWIFFFCNQRQTSLATYHLHIVLHVDHMFRDFPHFNFTLFGFCGGFGFSFSFFFAVIVCECEKMWYFAVASAHSCVQYNTIIIFIISIATSNNNTTTFSLQHKPILLAKSRKQTNGNCCIHQARFPVSACFGFGHARWNQYPLILEKV